jgi:hypothetical protein
MKYIILLILLLSFKVFATPHVEFTANRIHALLVFVEAISGAPNRPPHIKKIFEESKFNNSASLEKIKEFKELDSAQGRFLDFTHLPKERFGGISIRSQISIQSAFAKDLNDYRERILGLMTYSELNKFFIVLSYFEPIYDQLIWRNSQKELNRTVEVFKQKAVLWKMDKLFVKSAKFYSSSWPDNQNFRVSLYPIPRGANMSNAQSFGSFESVGIILGDKNIEGKFGVVFHELCHSLYDAQSAEIQKQWDKWFIESTSKYGPLTNKWINESLATALGNGWAYVKAKGKMDKQEWYHHDKINGLAQAIYPKAVDYLESDRAVDKEFIDFSISEFEKKFPQSLNEFETYLSEMLMLTDGDFGSSAETRRELRKHFRIQSLRTNNPIDHQTSKGEIRENALATIFIVLTQENKRQLEAIEDVLPGISKIKKNIKAGKNQIGLFDFEKRKVIILILDKPNDLNKALAWMGSNRKVDTLNALVNIQLEK